MRRTVFLIFLLTAPALAQVNHYNVSLTPDLDHHILRGEETIELRQGDGTIQLQKQRGLQITAAKAVGGDVKVKDEVVTLRLHGRGAHRLHFEYTSAPARGIKWFADQAGFDTAFYCQAWMVCEDSPAERATLTLEIILPASAGCTAVGPGRLRRQWRTQAGEHFVFEQRQPVQTYLFSFGVAKLHRAESGRFVVYAPDEEPPAKVFTQTAEAYAFLRSKATVDPLDEIYVQAFLPDRIAQESAGLALMSTEEFANLEQKDGVSTLAHELAHQWWGALVGIRSWSDFWLNEGMADFMVDAYLEQHQGKEAYEKQMAAARQEMENLREQGKDRPLHWEHWKDAHEALGPIPYVKGALFLDRLRKELGEELFWRGIGLYTARNATRLVDAQDFKRAMEQASGRDLQAMFGEGVYH